MFCENLKELAEEIKIELNDEQLKKFEIFYNLVIEWNEKINLTAITEPQEFIIKHLIDSLTLWDEEKFSSAKKIIDVGTGAGFPGIPLKIFKPNLEVVLLDSLNKRVEFLKKVVEELNLKNVTCLHGRAEDFAKQKNFREQFDLVTVRAVARLNIISEYCLPFVKIGGTFAALKGKQFREEISEAENAVKILGGGKINFVEKKLPTLPDVRAVIYIDKEKTTPKKFPRNAGTPTKNPL
ncbi:MAG: 16S rRNA (guanine(527)-N(7))-methyltransferase RsmG [Selenomonadaceae bacterium]|nr:16S rRNA (guanine(527)-N(7))-methyltransferase RsmG [Selenomonadaceae bacterium]